MKKLLKYLTSLMFLLFIGWFCVLSILPFSRSLGGMLLNAARGGKLSFSAVETAYNDQLPSRMGLITINGGVQRLMGARDVNDRYKLDNGQLTYIIPELDMSNIASNTVDFAHTVEELGIPILYVNTPFKIDPDDKQLPPHIEDYSNENADRFLDILRENQVDVLDLRVEIDNEGLDHYSLFYVTDHHWTAEAGFWAAGKIAERLRQLNPEFAVDPRLTDISNYKLSVYEKSYLGSAGYRTGPLYAGLDDITLIEPDFPTQLHFSVSSNGIDRTGSFSDTVLFRDKLNASYWDAAKYSSYMGSDYDFAHTENMSAEAGLEICSSEKKLLIIKDSFSNVVLPYMALYYDECYILDLRHYTGDLLSSIDDIKPDAVMIIYNPGAYEDNNTIMFEFLQGGDSAAG